MRKTFKYRLYPTSNQKKTLQSSLDACRWVYNQTLAIRKETWEKEQKSLSLFDTSNLLVQWKKIDMTSLMLFPNVCKMLNSGLTLPQSFF